MGVEEKALGQRLAQARRQAGLTQQELCQKAGLSYSTLAKIERGAIRSPSVFTVVTISAVTNTPLDKLLNIKPDYSTVPVKRVSKTGVRFVYFDINNVLVRFYQRAFTQIADQSGRTVDMVEALYWRHNDAVSSGEITLDEFNRLFEQELDLQDFDWKAYFMTSIEAMPGMDELVAWVDANFETGLLSNNLPGFIDELKQKRVIPPAKYKAIIDSSQAGCLKPEPKIYELAQQAAGVGPHEILLVDDTRLFLTAADQAGWQVVWFNELEPEASIERIKKYLEF